MVAIPDAMQAAVLTRHGGPEALELRTVPVPRPGRGEVLVRVTAAALNNTDLWTRRGAYGLPGDPDALAGWRGPITFPRIQGGDMAGEIAVVGEGVDADRVGRRVVVDNAFYEGDGPDDGPIGLLGSEADGGFAQYVVCLDERAHDVGASPLTDEELACLPVAYGTAAGMLARGRVTAGETVLVTGASGGVGLAAVQLAAARGARVVALTAPGKEEALREAGAAGVVLRGSEPGAVADAVAQEAGGPLDAVVDVVGGPLLPALLDRIRDGGRWVIAGAIGGHTVDLDLRRLYLHNVSLVGSSMHTRTHFAELVADAVAGRIRPRIAARYALADIHAAQEEFAGSAYVGKIVVIP